MNKVGGGVLPPVLAWTDRGDGGALICDPCTSTTAVLARTVEDDLEPVFVDQLPPGAWCVECNKEIR